MSHRKTPLRLVAAPLLMLALCAPPALAMGDTPYTDAERRANDRFNGDAAAATLLKNSRDVAEAYRTDAAIQRSAQQDRRSENTADPLPRVWPAYSRALPPVQNPAPAPTALVDDGDDDWVVPVLAISGTLLLGAGLATGRIRGRRVRPA